MCDWIWTQVRLESLTLGKISPLGQILLKRKMYLNLFKTSNNMKIDLESFLLSLNTCHAFMECRIIYFKNVFA